MRNLVRIGAWWIKNTRCCRISPSWTTSPSALDYAESPVRSVRDRAREWVNKVGLDGCEKNFLLNCPAECSNASPLPQHLSLVPHTCLWMSRSARWIPGSASACRNFAQTLERTGGHGFPGHTFGRRSGLSRRPGVPHGRKTRSPCRNLAGASSRRAPGGKPEKAVVH